MHSLFVTHKKSAEYRLKSFFKDFYVYTYMHVYHKSEIIKIKVLVVNLLV